MFDGTLFTWNTAPADLELNDDVKPVLPRPNPGLRVHEAMFRKEVKILVKLRVLEEADDSDWGAPYFPYPKAKKSDNF